MHFIKITPQQNNPPTKTKISATPLPNKSFSEIFNPSSKLVGGGACPESSIKTKSLNTKLCPAGLFPRIVAPTRCGLFPFSWTFMGNPGDGEKSYPTAKNLLISPIRKIPLNRFKSFAVKSFISSPSNSNFQVIILTAVISAVSYFKFQALCTHMPC